VWEGLTDWERGEGRGGKRGWLLPISCTSVQNTRKWITHSRSVVANVWGEGEGEGEGEEERRESEWVQSFIRKRPRRIGPRDEKEEEEEEEHDSCAAAFAFMSPLDVVTGGALPNDDFLSNSEYVTLRSKMENLRSNEDE
jgi:hypothetical protein